MATKALVLVCLIGDIAVPQLATPAIANEAALEYQVKAAMLYKFLGYTDWPEAAFPAADSPYRIWVLGSSNIERELREITAHRTVNDRPIQVMRARTVEHISNAHMVFVGHHAERYLPSVARLAEQHSFLVVTEREEGLRAGSTINLRLVEGRIGFDVSLAGAHRYNLRLSARLLSVASTVDQEGR